MKCNVVIGCSCVGTESAAASIKKADKIFSGKIIHVDTLVYSDTLQKFNTDTPFYKVFKKTRLVYTIQVLHCFKGKHDKRAVRVVTGLGGGDCGYEFVIGQAYIVYANWKSKLATIEPDRKRFLYTDICYRTQLYSEDEDKTLNSILKK